MSDRESLPEVPHMEGMDPEDIDLPNKLSTEEAMARWEEIGGSLERFYDGFLSGMPRWAEADALIKQFMGELLEIAELDDEWRKGR